MLVVEGAGSGGASLECSGAALPRGARSARPAPGDEPRRALAIADSSRGQFHRRPTATARGAGGDGGDPSSSASSSSRSRRRGDGSLRLGTHVLARRGSAVREGITTAGNDRGARGDRLHQRSVHICVGNSSTGRPDLGQIAEHQKENFMASCVTRASEDELITPNVLVPKVVAGAPKLTLFKKLKNSARNCIMTRSVTLGRGTCWLQEGSRRTFVRSSAPVTQRPMCGLTRQCLLIFWVGWVDRVHERGEEPLVQML